MYTDFSFIGMDTDIRNKTLIMQFTMDIDPETLSDDTVQIFDRKIKNDIECDLLADGKNVIVTFKDWPIPNNDYIVRVQNLKSVTGNDLTAGIRRPVSFKSNVLSTIEITYPAYDEQIVDLKMEWKEIPVNNIVVNSYYIEIATENAFYNIKLKTSVSNRQFIDLMDLVSGQYYARVRAQLDDGSYGYWSELVTFLVGDKPEDPGPIYDPPEEDPIFVGDINVIDRSEDGRTPGSFIIEFDQPIDPATLANIVIIRRDI